MQAARCGLLTLLLVGKPGGEGLHHSLNLVIRLNSLIRSLVELEVLFVEHNIDIAGMRELAQLQGGELDLRGTAAAKDVHIGHGRRFQPFVHILGNFGDEQIIGMLGEHTCNIQRHVAVTKHRDFLRVQRPGARVIGVTVIPRDEVGGTIGTVQVDALNR